MIFDDTNCLLGEGPMWHPERGELFWFDILGRNLHRKGQHWAFDCYPSAAGWVDNDTLLIATSQDFRLFNIDTGTSEFVAPFEADNPLTRSNDGRIDPWGGFWIGTMGFKPQENKGAIYRFWKGELRTLYTPVEIPNAICFSPDGLHAYWTDTETHIVWRQPLDEQGWPKGEPILHIDLRGTPYNPDGAVVDAAGNMWNAQWGTNRVAVYAPDGTFLTEHEFTASQTSCPAFGGADLTTLYCTSASAGLAQSHLAEFPDSGRTFELATATKGQREHRVIL